MSDHIAKSQMERFCARALGVSDLTIIAGHLTSCKGCHQLFQETLKLKRGDAPVSFTLAPEKWLQHEHLTYEQLAPYVENSLDITERELVNLHLQVCGNCREDVRSFQANRPQIESEAAAMYVSDRRSTWRDKLFARWNWLTVGFKPVYATAIVAVLVSTVILVALLSERNRNSDQQARQSQPGQTSEAVSVPPVNTSDTPTQTNTNQTTAATPSTNADPSNQVDNRVRPNPIRSSSPVPKVVSEPLRPAVNAVVALNDGQERIAVDNSGRLTGLDDVPQEIQESIRGVLLARNIQKPSSLSEITGDASALRGTNTDGPSFKLLSPARAVTENARPTFNWTQAVGATSYRVPVVDSQNREVANSGELPSNLTSWSPSKPLARGVVYTWVVTAVVDGREVIAPSTSEPEMRFKVLDEETWREINVLQQRTRSHLALGILYARAGMRAEAEREFQMLVKQNPNSSVAQKLLRSVQSW